MITLPFTLASGTTCGGVNDYTSANTGSCTASNNYKAGEDILWRFVAPSTGNVTITFTDNSGGAWMAAHLFLNCPSPSGTCIGTTGCSGCGAHSGTYPVTSGNTYYVMMDNWPSPSCGTFANLSITIAGAPPSPCAAPTPLAACGTTQSVTLTGSGDAAWVTNPCFSSPGQERIYSYTPPTTGAYTLTVTSATGGYIDYLWRTTACAPTGWTCIDDINLATGPLTIGTLTAGVPILLYLDAEGTSSRTHVFRIDCAAPITYNPCPPVGNIAACGSSGSVVSGTGAGAYALGPYTPSGQEKIFTYTANVTGVHTFNVTALTGSWIDFFWKPVGTCDGTGWNYWDDVNVTGLVPGDPGNGGVAPNFTSGQQYYIMWDAEDNSGRTVNFTVNCPSPVADPCAAQTAMPACGTSVTTTVAAGAGAWSGYLDCSIATFPINGKEYVYTYTPPASGNFVLEITALSIVDVGTYVEWLYTSNTCAAPQANWTCLADANTTGTTAPFALVGGTTYRFLVKAEGTGGASATWRLNCPPAPANDACAAPIVVSSYPYTSPVINNGWATDDLSAVICSGSGPFKNVWWTVTGVCGTMTAQTCGANFDTELAVYSGTCGSLVSIGCNDDAAAWALQRFATEPSYLDSYSRYGLLYLCR
ncbi:MAG: hypothetical protein IPG92_09880 [Flavobacteriales bacterium]|nr:hypothetical protein [Flavobacteriales bacterium]